MSSGGRAARVRGLLAGVLTVGTVGFGGGSALIPIFDKEFVAKRRILDEAAFTQHTVVANVTPGALPVKLAAAAGHTIAGTSGSSLAAIGVCAPGALATLAILAASSALGTQATRLISHAAVGISVFIIVLLIGYVWKVHVRAGRRRWLFLAITVLSAALSGAGPILRVAATLLGITGQWEIPHLSVVGLIVASLAGIALGSFLVRGRHRFGPRSPSPPGTGRRILRTTGAFVVLSAAGIVAFGATAGPAGWQVAGLLALSTMTSFGGGEAYVGVADGFFVRSGLVDSDMFFTQLVPIANALPGPILVKVSAGIGYSFGAQISPLASWALALAAILIAVGVSCGIAMPILGTYDSLSDHPLMIDIGTYILPVICGILVQVSATMLQVSASVVQAAGFSPAPFLWCVIAALVILSVVHIRKSVPDMLVLAGCAAVSLLVLGP